jgi:hypothetical protein
MGRIRRRLCARISLDEEPEELVGLFGRLVGDDVVESVGKPGKGGRIGRRVSVWADPGSEVRSCSRRVSRRARWAWTRSRQSAAERWPSSKAATPFASPFYDRHDPCFRRQVSGESGQILGDLSTRGAVGGKPRRLEPDLTIIDPPGSGTSSPLRDVSGLCTQLSGPAEGLLRTESSRSTLTAS